MNQQGGGSSLCSTRRGPVCRRNGSPVSSRHMGAMNLHHLYGRRPPRGSGRGARAKRTCGYLHCRTWSTVAPLVPNSGPLWRTTAVIQTALSAGRLPQCHHPFQAPAKRSALGLVPVRDLWVHAPCAKQSGCRSTAGQARPMGAGGWGGGSPGHGPGHARRKGEPQCRGGCAPCCTPTPHCSVGRRATARAGRRPRGGRSAIASPRGALVVCGRIDTLQPGRGSGSWVHSRRGAVRAGTAADTTTTRAGRVQQGTGAICLAAAPVPVSPLALVSCSG